MKRADRFQLDPDTLTLLQVIEASGREEDRRTAIFQLARRGGVDSARVLMETFDRCMWRATKFVLIQALGSTRQERATEFLCGLASDTDDLPMAGEAVLALGLTGDAVAGEFLASVVRSPQHPLLREALIAISSLDFFPCDREIAAILEKSKTETPMSVLQNAVIAAGLRGQRALLPRILDLLKAREQTILFNTALLTIGRIGNEETLEFLEQLDTRYRAFAHQLKSAALDHLRLALALTIEDAVAAALTAETPAAIRQAWQIIARFPRDTAREAVQILAQDANPEFRTMARVTFFNHENRRDDFRFLAEQSETLRPEIFASLARQHAVHASRDEILGDLNGMGEGFLLRFLGCVRVTRGYETLAEMAANSKLTHEHRVTAINALVRQPAMHGGVPDIRDAIGKRLVRLAESEKDVLIQGRLIRAVGQVGYMGPDALNFFRDFIKQGGELQDSIYSALAQIGTEESARILTKRLRQIIADPCHEEEVIRAIQSLARFGKIGDAGCLAMLPTKLRERLKTWLLKILCVTTVTELTSVVADSFESNDFQAKLLAVVAAKHHHNPEIWTKVFELLDHNNACLSGRALDTITTRGSAAEHMLLLQRLVARPDDLVLYQKTLRSLTPRPGEANDEVIAILDLLMKDRRGVMLEPEVFQAAVNLRDHLLVVGQEQAGLAKVSGKSKLSEKEKHAIDETLTRDIKGFAAYSETIKSVLRSGEVTWQHPELFDARVDKSTVLVQYVKSIDLLLQEKIGTSMFLAQGSDLLQKMQSRLVRLELDDEAGFDSQIVSNLECSAFFSRDTFPAHKLALLCKSIMSGQLMREQYRVIDGLRAWALLLILFGRTFKFRGQSIDPLFPLAKSSSDGICRIARAMNELQDARNRAAHRGTMLEMGNMQEMRALCASLLNDLHLHLLFT